MSTGTLLQCGDHTGDSARDGGLHTGFVPEPVISDTCLAHTALQPESQSGSFAFVPNSFPTPQNPFSPAANDNVDFSSRPFADDSSIHCSPEEIINNNQAMMNSNSTSECLLIPQDAPSDGFSSRPAGLKSVPAADTQGKADSKASSSDTCSDIDMNSASTVTLDSSDSDACLLKDGISSNENPQNHEHLQNNWSAEGEAPLSYTNQVFDLDGNKESGFDLSEDQKMDDDNRDDSQLVEEPSQCVDDCQSEECPLIMPDKDNTENEDNIVFQKDSALESLVHQLAEHHPTEVVSITVNEVDVPAIEIESESEQSLHKPTPNPVRMPLKHSLLHSSESLNAYKLSKQGYSNNPNRLQAQAINNWRARTMDNINLRSSFRNLASTSVSNLGEACRKAMSYLRTDMEFSSMMSLGGGGKKPSLLSVMEGEPTSDEDSSTNDDSPKGGPSVVSGRHMKNLLLMSLLITIFFVANFATRNLQSSLNQDGGVGVICLAVMFAFYILGSLLSPVMVQGFGVKRCIIGGLIFQLMYVAVNLYPTMWLMVPASMGGGVSLTVIWNAMSTYVVMLARGESNVKQKSYEAVSDRYFGIFCLIYQSNLIVGNLIAALVLSYGDGAKDSPATAAVSGVNSTVANLSLSYNESQFHQVTTNNPGTGSEIRVINGSSFAATLNTSQASPYDICGADFCHHYVISTGGASVSQFTTFLLFGIFMLLIVVCMLIGVFLLEPLAPHVFTSSGSPWKRVKDQIVSLGKFSHNKKFLLLLPLMLYSVMQFSFVTSEITVAFMTCPIGVWMVGYCMMSYGANCSISSYICQALAPRIGRGFFIAIAAAINIGLLVCLRFWKPDADSTVPVLIIASLFGFCDGIWNVSVNGMCGSVFPDHFEEAFTGLRVAQGIGGTFNMAYSPLFCLTVKIYVMMGVVTVVFLGYVGAEILIRREQRGKQAVLYEEEIDGPEKEKC